MALDGSLFEKTVPGNKCVYVYLPTHLAATSTEKMSLFVAPYDCRLKAVHFAPNAAVTGANTNTTHLNIIDAGAAGAGTTELGALDLTSGNDLVAHTDNAVVSGLTTDLTLGDAIVVEFEKVGTGLLVPPGIWMIEFDGG